MPNAALEKLFDQIRALTEAEYGRGYDAAWKVIDQARQSIKTLDAPPDADDSRRGRAPVGQSRTLVDEVLKQRGLGPGATPMEIYKSPLNVNKQVSYGAIRKILKTGKEQGRYRNKDGRWRMVQFVSAPAA